MQSDVISFTPGTKVDILYRVSDPFTEQVSEYWVSGYEIFNPTYVEASIDKNDCFVLKKRKKKVRSSLARQKAYGFVLVVLENQQGRAIGYPPEFVRLHDPTTSVSFSDVFGHSTSSVVVDAVMESEQEDLRLGAEAFDESVSDSQSEAMQEI